MKDEILKNLEDLKNLESLYRQNKNSFKKDFLSLYPEIRNNTIAAVWYERLNYSDPAFSWGKKRDLIFIIISCLLAFVIAKIPEFTNIPKVFFYTRNIAFIFVPFLILNFILKEKSNGRNVLIISGALLISCLYINILPDKKSDSITLACIFMPFLIWSLLGFSFLGNDYKDNRKHLAYLNYNGNLTVMTSLLLIAGVVLTGITVALFESIDLHIESFYMQYIVIAGLVSAPLIGTYLIEQNPWLINRVSPVIAKVFTPLLLITLIIYFISTLLWGESPSIDRRTLGVFNLLLIGVMALLLYSIVGTKESKKNKLELIMLFSLAAVTFIINVVVISSITYRIISWGWDFTPNRLALLGTNIIILTHLSIVSYHLFGVLISKSDISSTRNSIVTFLPVYIIWSVIIIFGFPIAYQMI